MNAIIDDNQELPGDTSANTERGHDHSGTASISQFATTARWIASRLWLVDRPRLIVATAAQALASLLLVAVSAMVIVYARAYAAGEDADFLGIPIGHAQRWDGKLVFALVLIGSAAGAGGCRLWSERIATSISIELGGRCRSAVLDVPIDAPVDATTDARLGGGRLSQQRDADAQQAFVSEIRDIELAARQIVLMSGPATLLIVSSGILIYSGVLLALMLIPVAGLHLLALRHQARRSRLTAAAAAASDRQLRQTLRSGRGGHSDRSVTAIIAAAGAADRLAHRRSLIGSEAKALATVSTAVAAVVLMLGGVALNYSITELIPCILAVRFVMQSVESLGTRVVGIARRAGSVTDHVVRLTASRQPAGNAAARDGEAVARQGSDEPAAGGAATGDSASSDETPDAVSTKVADKPHTSDAKKRAASGSKGAHERAARKGRPRRHGLSLDCGGGRHLAIPAGETALVVCAGKPTHPDRLNSVLQALQRATTESGALPGRGFSERVQVNPPPTAVRSANTTVGDEIRVLTAIDPRRVDVDTQTGVTTLVLLGSQARWTGLSETHLELRYTAVICVGRGAVTNGGTAQWFRTQLGNVGDLCLPRGG